MKIKEGFKRRRMRRETVKFRFLSLSSKLHILTFFSFISFLLIKEKVELYSKKRGGVNVRNRNENKSEKNKERMINNKRKL